MTEPQNTPALEAQVASGAIVHEGKVLNTTFEIAAAARKCTTSAQAAALLDSAKRAGGSPELVLSVVRGLCAKDPCAKYFEGVPSTEVKVDAQAPAKGYSTEAKRDTEAT